MINLVNGGVWLLLVMVCQCGKRVGVAEQLLARAIDERGGLAKVEG